MNANEPAYPQRFGNPQKGYEPDIGFTKPERACIDLRIPRSGDKELDALIAEAQRRDLAAMAMQAMVSSIHDESAYLRMRKHASLFGLKVSQWIACDSVKQADALLAELAKKGEVE